MSQVRPTDDDYRACVLELSDLIVLQEDAEQRGFATRWSSVSALQSHVADESMLLLTLLREIRNENLRAYRCLLRFRPADSRAGDVAVSTIDVAPDRLGALRMADDGHPSTADLMRLLVIPKR